MECPYCGEEMSQGKLGATCLGLVEWTPEAIKSKFKHLLGFESERFETNAKVKAHKCEICSKIIIDLLDDFNKNSE